MTLVALTLLAQADVLRPPQPGESINSWLIYSLMFLVLSLVSGLMAVLYYVLRVAFPKLMEDARQERQQLSDGCERRAERRSEAHRQEVDGRTRQFLDALKEQRDADSRRWELVFGDEDIERVVRHAVRRNRLDPGAEGKMP